MLASIQRIISLEPIPKADLLEKASILGWEVVVKKGMFKPGELVCYVQIDTVSPKDNPYFDFLEQRNHRIRTIKLRGQISQGLIIGLKELPVFADRICHEGDDVTELVGITKFSKEVEIKEDIPKQPKSGWKKYQWLFKQKVLVRLFPSLKQVNRAPFPTDKVSITDEERIQNIPHVLDQYKGQMFHVREKLNGSSITIIHEHKKKFKIFKKSHYRICSRNRELFQKNNEWHKVFESTTYSYYINCLVEHFGTPNIIVQGEYIGKPQGNYHQIDSNEIRIFNIYVDGKRILPEAFNYVSETYGIPCCPLLSVEPLNYSMDEIKAYAKGKSTIGAGVEREGLVMRSVDGKLSFKVISDNYLLKNNE